MLLIGGLLWRVAIAYWLFPGYDEAYYSLYSQHLDWSYFDHPVLVALSAGLGPWLTGVGSQFTLRWGSLLLYTGSLWLLYRVSARLFAPPAPLLTLAIATIVPLFQLGFGVLALPDSPLIFCWSLTLYWAVIEFFPENQAYRPSFRLILLGMGVAFACLSKYHGFMLGVGLLGFCLTSPPHRCVWRSPWSLAAIGAFLVCLSPLWIWNWQHDWVSFRFQLSGRFDLDPDAPPTRLSLFNLLGVFLTQIGYLLPTLGLPLWWVTAKAAAAQCQQPPIKLESHRLHLGDRLILWLSLPLALGFTLLGCLVQILPAWPAPGLWGLTLLLGRQAALWSKQSHWVSRWLWFSGGAAATLMLLALLHVTTGTLQKPSQYALLGGFIPPERDPSTELIDVRQLEAGFRAPLFNQALKQTDFVFTNAYYLGGLIDMALRPLHPISILCFSNDCRGFPFWSPVEPWVGQDALYITLERFAQQPALTREFQAYFQDWQLLGTVPLKRGGAVTETFYVYQAQALQRPYQPTLRLLRHP